MNREGVNKGAMSVSLKKKLKKKQKKKEQGKKHEKASEEPLEERGGQVVVAKGAKWKKLKVGRV